MRHFKISFIGAILAAAALAATADTFTLNDGKTITGDILTNSVGKQGVPFKLSNGSYSPPVPWEKFSQEDLKSLSERLPRAVPFIEPHIVETVEEKRAKTAIEVKKDFPKLERPPRGSLLGGLLSSPVGIVVLLLIYAANIYAAYEISIFRGQSTALVCGVAAVAPVIGPIIFLSIPTKIPKAEDEWAAAEAQAAAAEGVGEFVVAEETPGQELHLAHPTHAPASHALPPTETFARGQFTINRRFFETKFPGFFGIIKRDADKDMVLIVKASRGNYVVHRIARIAPNEIHVQVQHGQASQEVIVPFTEIQEVQLKHKDAP